MQGNWSHDRPHYRCRFAAEYPIPQDGHPRNIFIREDAILPALDGWLASVFDPDNLDATCDALAAASRPLPTASDQRREITRRRANATAGSAASEKALVGNGDATVIGGWIAEAQREREQLAHDLAMLAPGDEISRDEARDLVESFEDLTTLISDASPEHKAALYKELGIELTHQPDGRLLVEARPRRLSVRVGGGT